MKLARSVLLWASQSPRMERIVRSSRAMRPLVRRFMPGETLEDAIAAAKTLRSEEKTPTIITYLGENVNTDAAAEAVVTEYERLFAAIKREGLDTHVSIKLTQFGWDVDKGKALDRVRRVLKVAEANGTILPIDIESSPYVDSTIGAYETLARESKSVGLCIQAYLHRTPADVKRLMPLPPYVRLVKGAYREKPEVALQNRPEVDAAYLELAKQFLAAQQRGARVVFGTHDVALVERVRAAARELGVPESAFEVQMLYGIQDAGRRKLASDGIRTRVLISYGKAWYPWFMRRLAEKPANVFMIARNVFAR
jgi:proline dehydrogenase